MATIKTIIKLQIPAGKANPAPPVGPALGQHGLNIQDFVNKFNTATANMGGDIVTCEITVYDNRTFDFKIKSSPAAALLKKLAGIEKGSGIPNKTKVGKVSKAQIREIAEKKIQDLNANSLESAMKIIEGSARSMGIEVKEG